MYNRVTVAETSNIMREPEQAIFTGPLNMLSKIRDDRSLLPYVKTLKFCGHLALSWSQSWDNPVGAETTKYNTAQPDWHFISLPYTPSDTAKLKHFFDLHKQLWPESIPELRPLMGTPELPESLSMFLDHDRNLASTILLMLTLPALKHIDVSDSQRGMFLAACSGLQLFFNDSAWPISGVTLLQNLTRLTITWDPDPEDPYELKEELEDLIDVLSLPNLQILECHNFFASSGETLDRYSRRPERMSLNPAGHWREYRDSCSFRAGHHTLRHVYLHNSSIQPHSLWSFVRLLRGLISLHLEFEEHGCRSVFVAGDFGEGDECEGCMGSFEQVNNNSRPYVPEWKLYQRAFHHAACADGEKADFRMTFGINGNQREFLKLER